MVVVARVTLVIDLVVLVTGPVEGVVHLDVGLAVLLAVEGEGVLVADGGRAGGCGGATAATHGLLVDGGLEEEGGGAGGRVGGTLTLAGGPSSLGEPGGSQQDRVVHEVGVLRHRGDGGLDGGFLHRDVLRERSGLDGLLLDGDGRHHGRDGRLAAATTTGGGRGRGLGGGLRSGLHGGRFDGGLGGGFRGDLDLGGHLRHGFHDGFGDNGFGGHLGRGRDLAGRPTRTTTRRRLGLHDRLGCRGHDGLRLRRHDGIGRRFRHSGGGGGGGLGRGAGLA